MNELCSMTADNPGVLNSANKVLRLCSVAQFRLHGLDRSIINLDAVEFVKVKNVKAKKELFDIVVLALLCLARWHSAWFNAMRPAMEENRAVILWGMEVPGTGDIVGVRTVFVERVRELRICASQPRSSFHISRVWMAS